MGHVPDRIYGDITTTQVRDWGFNTADPRVACRLHLFDLKRAGHRARDSELKLPRENNAVSIIQAQAYGSMGSPGGLCAEATGQGNGRHITSRGGLST